MERQRFTIMDWRGWLGVEQGLAALTGSRPRLRR
jgi:hypothetical protein